MLSIYNSSTDKNVKYHSNLTLKWIKGRISRYLTNAGDVALKGQLLADIHSILSNKQASLLRLSNRYNIAYPKVPTPVNGKMELLSDPRLIQVFNYTEFRRKFGFDISNQLGITCCPYCNRNYTTTHETKRVGTSTQKLVFPEFDHFYPKSDHPILAVSFYNLIPSCNVCNTHYKGSEDPIAHNLFHPYTKIMTSHFNFKFFAQNYGGLIGKDLSIKLDFDYNSTPAINRSLKDTIAFFDIKAIYENCHSGIIKDMIDKRIAYCDDYLLQLQTNYKLNFNQAYKILFETYYNEEDLHKRPFSKLKKDIYHDLEIAKFIV